MEFCFLDSFGCCQEEGEAGWDSSRKLWKFIQRLQAGSASPNPCILCQHREDGIFQGPLKQLNMQFPKCLRSLILLGSFWRIPAPFFPPSLVFLFFILLQITRVGPLLIVLCVTSHQDKRRRGRGKSHMKILKQATGMSTDWWESLFLIHISLFTVGSSSLAVYGILSNHSWFLLSLSWRVGPCGSCCTSVGWK